MKTIHRSSSWAAAAVSKARPPCRPLWLFGLLLLWSSFGGDVAAQEAAAPADDNAAGQAEKADAPDGESGDGSRMVSLNLPEELRLKVLVDYVSERQGVNFIYDGNLLQQSVSLKAPNKIPAAAMRTLLRSVLRMKGLAITKTDVEGLLRIERVRQLANIAKGPAEAEEIGEDAPPTVAVTRLFPIKHAQPQRIIEVVSPFLSGPNASLTVLSEHEMVLVTDYANNMPRIEEMFRIVDREGPKPVVEFAPVRHLKARAMSEKVERLLEARRKASGQQRGGRGSVTLLPDERTNRVTIVGLPEAVDEAVELVGAMDVPLGLETKIYSFTVADPARVDELVRALIGELAAERLYKSATDGEANLLIATTTPQIHGQVEALRQRLDAPRPEEQSPIRFYKLENAKATDIVSLLSSLEGDEGLSDVTIDGVSVEVEEDAEETPSPEFEGPTEAEVNRREEADGEGALEELGADGNAVELPDARVLADEATNMIIVVAKPSVQRIYKKLIDRLDVRRPQVLIEATVVVLDTTDDFSLGVEIFSGEEANSGDLLNFTQFGISTQGSQPGSITLNPGTGFTGALLNANVAEVVIRALETDSRAKVLSRPSVLVNDNATGSLVSEEEEPFETVSVSETSVERSTFGGFASAGTNISITPQISEGDHLKLEYEITLSSFQRDETAAAGTLPPARQTDTLASEATVPDGHTIVVGGLTRENFNNTVDRVPLLGSIPGLEFLFSSRREITRKRTLFVFINATILRDDKFEDLKILSEEAASRADIAGAFPESEPVSIP